jgi:hypothetical protein
LILGVLNGFKVSGGDVAGGTDECKIHGVGAKVRRSKGAKGQREVSRKGAKTQRKRRKKEKKGVCKVFLLRLSGFWF